MAPTRDPVPAKGRGRFRLRRPSVSIPDSTPLESLDFSNANVSEISLAPMDRSADNRSDLSVSSSGSWRRKDSSGKPPLMFKPPALRYRPSRPELNRPWRRSNEAVYPSADDTNDSDVESKYSFDSHSTITNATSVEDFDTYPSKSDTYTSAVRTRPFTVEKQVVKTNTVPPPPAKPASLKGARVDIVAPKRQTVHIEVAPVAPAPPVVQHITSHELREREKVEDGLLKEISRMKEETKSLLGKQSDTDKRLEDALERLSTLSADKEKTEKKRREERSLKDKIARDFDEQSRLLDNVKSCLNEHEKKLEDVARERDQLKGIKQELEAKSNDLEKQIALERDAKEEVASKNIVLEMDIAEQEKIKKHFETRCRDLERSVGDAHYVTKETERALIERIAALELTKESLQMRVTGLETELIRKGTEIGDITAERNLLRMDVDKYKPQVDQLNKENGALAEASKGLQARIDDLDQQKKGLQANIEKLETDKKNAQDSYDALEAEKKGLEADIEKLNTEKKDIEGRFGALEVEKKDIQDRFNALEAEKQEVEVRLTQLETTNTDIQTRFESLEATKGELEVSKGELETQVKDLEGVKAKYDKLKTRVEGLKGKNTTLQTQIVALLKDQDDKSSQILSLAEERNSLRSENASLKDENESVTSELRRAESLMGSIAGSAAPSVVGSTDGSDADTIKGEDEAPPPPVEAPPAPPAVEITAAPVVEEVSSVEEAPLVEETKDDAASIKSAAPSKLSKMAPDPEVVAPEAAPVEDDAVTEKAESVSAKSITPSESAVMEELRQRIAELQDRNDQLQSETIKLGSLMAERDELVTRVATLEPEAGQAPQLRQENATLMSQLTLVNAQLDGLRASYDASVAEVNSLKDQIGQLRGRLSTPSLQSRSRESSHARQPTKTKKDNDKKKEQLVVVRNPNERGGIQIMRRCDLRMKRSSSEHSHSEGEKSE
ncbi:rna polymerase rpb1 c-terminal repeat domain-containing protein [Colletotrichum incanum]|uniref:Rna polymerase rpb1 c-terminal repeat domain-containing protein n=1 Tax=Colletotrichum incanum TaxID=1573173 RepID=A0A162N9W6_COLIC|nr:rna polymerase rpb1 c-terminal repeat domain-containing protein [Colletotrichum incanum]